jgi:hypothetical protein
MNALHRVSTDSGGLLAVNVVRSKRISEEEFEGPRGFGNDGRSSTEYFGPLDGLRFLKGRFNPLADLEKLKTLAESFPAVKSSDEAFYWICEHEDLSVLKETESRLRELIRGYEELIADIGAAREFFNPVFFNRLGEWGRHPDNPLRLLAEERGGIFTLSAGRNTVKFKPNSAALNVAAFVNGLN